MQSSFHYLSLSHFLDTHNFRSTRWSTHNDGRIAQHFQCNLLGFVSSFFPPSKMNTFFWTLWFYLQVFRSLFDAKFSIFIFLIFFRSIFFLFLLKFILLPGARAGQLRCTVHCCKWNNDAHKCKKKILHKKGRETLETLYTLRYIRMNLFERSVNIFVWPQSFCCTLFKMIKSRNDNIIKRYENIFFRFCTVFHPVFFFFFLVCLLFFVSTFYIYFELCQCLLV